MFKKIILVQFFLLFIALFGHSQDTLTLMSYNLLKYSSTNLNRSRYQDLKKIIKETKPDILMVCELLETTAAQFLLDSAVNAAGIGTYSRATIFDGPDTDNMLYYNINKINFRSQKQIATVLRDISQYVVYKTISPGDTAFLYLHMAHLKAGIRLPITVLICCTTQLISRDSGTTMAIIVLITPNLLDHLILPVAAAVLPADWMTGLIS